jgi:FkbM family methyltransferase
MLFGGMEESQLRWLGRAFPRLTHAWDIGAHHGLYTIALARLAAPAGIVHAFEPFPGSAEVLRANLELNGLQDIARIHTQAVGTRAGRARLNLSLEGPQNHSLTIPIAFSGESIDIDVIALDDAVQEYGRPEFVKIDVEGGELEVFSGADGLLEQRETCFLFESEAWDPRRSKVHKLLRTYGYKITTLSRGREIPGTDGRMLLARPSGQHR